MARVKGGYTTRRRRKKILKLAKGYFGANIAVKVRPSNFAGFSI